MYKKIELNSLLSQLDGWSSVDEKEAIIKKFTFKNFDDAFKAVTKIAEKAEQMDHHPEWFNVYNRLEITLTTHDAGGVTSYDQEMAEFIDQICR